MGRVRDRDSGVTHKTLRFDSTGINPWRKGLVLH